MPLTNLWLDVQDVIGGKEHWPQFIVMLFWTGKLNYKDRLTIASFCYQNGLDPQLMIECLKFTNCNMTPRKERKLRDLYDYWSDPNFGIVRRSNYFAYEIDSRRVLDLNGCERGQSLYTSNSRNLYHITPTGSEE